jgi:cAMP-dependent protein kinase regulator
MEQEMMDLLERCPLLTSFHEGQMESLYERVQILEFEPDQIIVEEGAPGSSVFILVEGSVDIEKKTPEGDQMVLTTLSNQGDFFGEMAIVDVRPRSATVRAKGNTRLLSLTKEALYDLFDQYPELMIIVPSNIAKVLAERLRSVDETMSVLAG